MRMILVSAAVIAISGCAVTKRTFAPDGREAVSINCSGWAMGWDSCYKKAGDICQSAGYDVLAVNGETGTVVTANPQSAFGGTIMNRVMLISCKASEAPKSASVQKAYIEVDGQCRTRVVSAGGHPVEDDRCPR
jgi:hypothetical protein